MSAFVIPTPCVIPLNTSVIGKSKFIDVVTKIKLQCETELHGVDIFYTIDGTKPEPYVRIVQGSKTYKYTSPFCLPAGKVTVKAMAVNSVAQSMCSSVITKVFHVKNIETEAKNKKRKSLKENKKCVELSNDIKVKEISERCNEEQDVNQTVQSSDFADNEQLKNESEGSEVHLDADIEEDLCVATAEVEQSVPNMNETFVIGDVCDSQDQENEVNETEDDDLLLNSMAKEQVMPDLNENVREENCSSSLIPHCCNPSDELPLQPCPSCSKVNSIFSRFCDKCGIKLFKICNLCKETNPSVAIFCQYCGKKLVKDVISHPIKKKAVNVGTLIKPVFIDNSTQTLKCSTSHKSVQTMHEIIKSSSHKCIKKLPTSSVGKGYWHQQTDYICNHLKAQAYNNLDFRKLISAPALGHFLSANIEKNDEKITVFISFESLSSHHDASGPTV